MREFLKGLGLESDVIDTIMAEHGKLMTKNTEQIGVLKNDLANAKNQLKTFEDVDLNQLNEQITSLNAEKAAWVQEKAEMEKTQKEALKDLKKNFKIDLAIKKSNPVDEVAYRAHMDASKLVYDEEKDELSGFDDIDKQIRANNPYLFEQPAGGDDHGGIESNRGSDGYSIDASVADYYTSK